MSKKRLHSRIVSLTSPLCALLLTFSLLLPYAPLHAAESPEPDPTANSEMPSDAYVWSGEISFGFASGSGGRYDPYLIERPEELAYLAERVNSGEDYSGKYFRLTTDLYLNDLSDYGDWQNPPPLHEWTPIGGYISLSVTDEDAYTAALAKHGTLYLRTETGYEEADGYIQNAIYYQLASFNGHLDGDGHTVYGLYIYCEQPCVGLFGAVADATLTDLTLKRALIKGSDAVGALIGRLDVTDRAELRNCRIDADVTAAGSMVGGLVGAYTTHSEAATLLIDDCSATGDLNALDRVGGLIGSAAYTDTAGTLQIEDSSADIYITAHSAAGGIVGHLGLPATLLSLSGNGAITADSNVGGIVGELTTDIGYTTLSECKNNASLVGQNAVGGIVGLCAAHPQSETAAQTDDTAGEIVIELLGCANLGDLFGTQSAGGIIGSATTVDRANVNLIGCKNSAAISGKNEIGGIAGTLLSETGLLTIGSTENHGAVSASSLAGGIAGTLTAKGELTLYQCVSYGAVTASQAYAGGIAGKMTASDNGTLLLELSCSSGSVKASEHAGGIVGSQMTDSPSADCTITNCFSYAQLASAENVGGIAGSVVASSGQATVSNCIFVGSFASGGKLTGGIAAYAYAQNADAAVQIDQCYYHQSTANRPVLLYGGNGSELCQSSSGLSDDALKNPDQLIGLDFTSIWQASDEENKYPTLRAIPFIRESFRYTVSGKSATLVAYLGKSDVVVIPAKLGGMAVTTIGDSAFSNCSMAEVILPDSVTTIGEYAFADCKNLRSITLSSELRTVGAAAFKNCTALETRRSASPLTDLYTGSENGAFTSLPIIGPLNLEVDFLYEDGTTATKSSSITCYPGEHYLIDAPAITGYEADIGTMVGICRTAEKLGVIYRLGSYRLTIRYLYPDGSEAAESHVSTFLFGEQYSIPSPDIPGYLPANSIVEGQMEGSDLILTVYYSQSLVQPDNERSANQSLLIALLICASFALVCCIGYFIFRYRSNHPKQEDGSDFDSLFTPRF